MTADKDEQRAFLDRFYGWSGPVYDVTRRYWLLGREPALERLYAQPWNRLIEIGPGTGRNLAKLHARRPYALLGGVEPSRAMLRRVQKRCPYARVIEGFAEDARFESLLDAPPDRVFFSYCLSMVHDPEAALANALAQVAPGGKVVVADFGDLGRILEPARSGLKRFLEAFHVRPLRADLLEGSHSLLEYGPGRYWIYAEIFRPVEGAPHGTAP